MSNSPNRLSQSGRQFLKSKEAWRSKAYQDEKGVWTIGWGFTKGVKPGDTMTQAEGEIRFNSELREYEQGVFNGTKDVETTQGQFDAMVILAYNIGVAGFSTSTVLRQHRAGNYTAASRAFGLWNMVTVEVNGKKVKRESNGLTNRRREEANMYLAATPKVLDPKLVGASHDPDAEDATPDAERNVGNSQIGLATKAGGTVTAIAATTEVVNQVSYAKKSMEDLSDWMVPILLVVMAGLCYYIWRQRKKQRDGGWA